MAAPTGATLLIPSKPRNFHLIRPVCALGTFPSRGRLAKVFCFFAMEFFVVCCYSCSISFWYIFISSATQAVSVLSLPQKP